MHVLMDKHTHTLIHLHKLKRYKHTPQTVMQQNSNNYSRSLMIIITALGAWRKCLWPMGGKVDPQ